MSVRPFSVLSSSSSSTKLRGTTMTSPELEPISPADRLLGLDADEVTCAGQDTAGHSEGVHRRVAVDDNVATAQLGCMGGQSER